MVSFSLLTLWASRVKFDIVMTDDAAYRVVLKLSPSCCIVLWGAVMTAPQQFFQHQLFVHHTPMSLHCLL